MTERDTRLKDLRVALGLTQREQARVFGMAVSSYAALERGQRRLTIGHMAMLRTFEFVVQKDLFPDFMTCISQELFDMDGGKKEV